MCRCSFCLPRRGSYGASDWIHWTGHHGTPHGEESPEGGIPPRRPQPKPRARGRARPGGRESRHLAARRRSAVRGGDHHAAQLARSEEHTSELQSPCNLVCRLLLEKKKKKTKKHKQHIKI